MNTEMYIAHLKALVDRYEQALNTHGYDCVVISSGSLAMVAEDDRAYPYNPRPFAQQWVPYDIDPDTFIVFTPGDKPRLLWPARADFWHLTPQAPGGEWAGYWSVEAATGLDDWLPKLTGRIAWIGPRHPALAEQGVQVDIDPAGLKAELSYYRAYKTDFEIECMAQANRKAVAGHQAARDAFLRGASEAEIYRDYLAASEQLESQEPYSGIIALNEAAATLHYERRRFTPPAEHRTLLIDAGARVNGYASDITRTHTTDGGLFADLRLGLDALQQTLNASVKPGVTMTELQNQALAGVAGLLRDHGLCRLPVEEQLAKRVPHAFFPHGLGHLLGLQVHDVGGHQQTPEGETRADDDNPFLRLTRTLESSMVITMEPGLYFIPMLLDRLMQREPDHGLDLALIERLKPYGGIRIEDNLVVSADGARNLTREAFKAQH
ncbi:Xaa-Pro dipeptidase [Saccharospirillum salsuginis]|uniref:Xaa-Pro dipeptidase n=1 Tax=Saccharospirillum salsuginis TaxID=418750 RepID=A0A918KQC6_9GAMM|nr:Xaa-Pro dipeptidase [Saccharospirillum salsuginis]GGX71860.1 Xaa-Pro dipeptidase [Saccharospirillum salsuginis]